MAHETEMLLSCPAVASERNVRLELPDGGTVGFATTTYSYNLTEYQRELFAALLAEAWNKVIALPHQGQKSKP